MERLNPADVPTSDPSIPLLCGAILCSASTLTDVSRPMGAVAEGVLIAAACALHKGRSRHLLGLIAAGIAFFAPVALLGSPTAAWKGLAAMLTIMAPMAGRSRYDWSVAARRVPLPRTVKLLIEQILHQSEVLGLETQNVYRALSVRSARRGITGLMTFSHTLPSVWLPRVAHRAERVAIAMDVRGYTEHVPRSPALVMGFVQWVILAVAVAISCAAVLVSHVGRW